MDTIHEPTRNNAKSHKMPASVFVCGFADRIRYFSSRRGLCWWTIFGVCFFVLCCPATHGQSGRVKRKPDESPPPVSNSNQNEKPKKAPEMVDGPNGKEIVYSTRSVDRKAIILKKPEARYPRKARDHDVAGLVIVSIILSASREVTNIRIVRGVRELNDSAIDAASQIKFEPAIKDGKPVATRVLVEYRFNIY